MADNMDVSVRLEAVDEASPKIRRLKDAVDALRKSLDSLEADKLRKMLTVPDDVVSSARRNFDVLASLKAKVDAKAAVASSRSGRSAAP